MPTADELYTRAVREILEDVGAGTVPADVPDFAALHDHVDANEYGGACEVDPDGIDWPTLTARLDEVQNRLDAWIKQGGIREVVARWEAAMRPAAP